MKRLSFIILILALVLIVPLHSQRVSTPSTPRLTSATVPSQGLVCFSQITSSCPSQAAQFSDPIGSTFTAYIVVQASQPFSGFNIWFQYPYGVLNATSVSLHGTVLPGATVQFECINGQGSSSCGYWLGNGPSIVAVEATGGLTTAPTTGLLYSVNFKVIGNGSGNLGFFCVTTPSGPWILGCASLTNGLTGLNVGVQGATFITGPGSSSGTTIPIMQTLNFDHLTATLSGSVTIDLSVRTLTGNVSVTVVNSTTGGVIFSKTFTFSFSFGATSDVRFVLAISLLPWELGATCDVSTSNNTVSCMLTRDPDPAKEGLVTAVDASMIIAGYGSAKGSSSYNPTLDLDGDGMVDAVDASIVILDYAAPVFT